jgi:hypothetical protein
MSQDHGRDDVTWDVATDLSTHQHKFVKVTAAHTVGLCGLGQRAIGVLKNMPDNNKIKTAQVRQANAGVSFKVRAAAAIPAGSNVTSDANGFAIVAGAGQEINGIAREAAAIANDVIECTSVTGGKA